MTLVPMLANPLELANEKHARQWKRVVNEGYTMQEKLDGMRLILVFNFKGRLESAYTRSGRNVVDIIPSLWRYSLPDLPPWTVFDCEFGYTQDIGNGSWLIDFNKTMRVMGSGPEVAQQKSEALGEMPKAFVFDTLMVRDSWKTNLPQGERGWLAPTIFDNLGAGIEQYFVTPKTFRAQGRRRPGTRSRSSRPSMSSSLASKKVKASTKA
jgi:ATP-dependent DNA ligase